MPYPECVRLICIKNLGVMPIFNFDIPNVIGDIPDNILFPWKKWTSKVSYIDNLTHLANQFIDNFEKYNLPDLAQKGGPIL